MGRRRLLTDEERRLLFGVPEDPDVLARHYTLTRSDLDRVAIRRGDANRLGFAVQLALLRRHGLALAQMEEPVAPLVDWLARWLERSANHRRFDSYLLPATAAPAVTATLGLPATADEWLTARGGNSMTASWPSPVVSARESSTGSNFGTTASPSRR